ncbi:MAG: tetratricopeptide repeat protein [Deltaproteobacteria bacterium]|nr:tetratricopeptide repeat protein [Deltaproteobacteria bacterium]
MDSQAALKVNLRYFSDKWKKLVEVDGKGCKVCLTREQQLKILLEWGEEKFSRGDFRGAVRIFKRVLEIDRTNSEALNNIGVIQWQLGDTASAMTIFQNSLAINPRDPDALGNLARAAAETGRFDRIDPGLLEILKAKQPANPYIDRIIEARQGLSIEGNREARA